MDCISPSLQIALEQDQEQSPVAGTHSAPAWGQSKLGTALLGCPQGWELSPSAARRHQGAGYPLLLPLTTSGSHLDAVPIGVARGGEVPQGPQRQKGAEATAAVLDIFEDHMRFVIVFPLSFLPLYFVTDKGERKPKLSF